MTAIEALEAYGYRLENGVYVRQLDPDTERWEPVTDGFLCYKKVSDWGKLATNGLMAIPYTQTAAFKNIGGLHPDRQPECFEWTWPEERVLEIYTHTGIGWIKTVNEAGHV